MSKKQKRSSDPRPGRGSLRRQRRRASSAGLRGTMRRTGLFLQRNRSAVKALVVFAACMLALLLLYSRITDSGPFDGFRAMTARATAFTLNLFGADVSVAGDMVQSPDFSMGIIAACTGIIPMAIFVSATLAYPATASQKSLGMALGVVAIYAVNLVRTSTLFVVGTHFPTMFDTAHYLVWQSLMILAAATFWYLWVSRFAGASTTD